MNIASMAKHRGARAPGFLMVGLLCACATDGPSGVSDEGYRSLPMIDGRLVDSAEAVSRTAEFMRAAGCKLVTGRPPAGAIWVQAPPAPAQRFDCNHLSADSAQQLARVARLNLLPRDGGANAYSDPGYWEITTEETFSCSGLATWTITSGGQTAAWVVVTMPDGEEWEYWLEPGVPTKFSFPTGCGWVERVTGQKFGGGGTPMLPEPGEFPTTGGGGGPSQYPTNEPRLMSIAVTPAPLILEAGQIAQFRATLSYDVHVNVESWGDVTWLSNSSIAVEDDRGTFQTISSGTATITATLGSVTGSATLVVRQPCIPDTTSVDSLLISDPYPYPDAPELEICTGTGSADCMRNNPGTWLGSYPIPKLGGFFIHTALATTRGLAPRVSELVGWDNFPLPFVNQIWIDSLRIREPTPAYSTDFSAYKWIKVGSEGSTYLADQGINVSAAYFQERPYFPPASNVFVSKALYAGGFTLTEAQYRAAGGWTAPMLNRCNIVAG